MNIKKIVSTKAKILLLAIGIISVILVATFMIGIAYVNRYQNPSDLELAEAGIVEKNVQVGDVNFNYAEGPDNGPPLLLLHAQLLDWYTYSEVLPELSTKFHVFALDYPGHGKTTYPEEYQMTANQIGSDLSDFIQLVIQEPVYITGNSSGGLLTTWLASNEPELVKAIVLEDPPLFSAEYPAIKETIAYKSFTTSYNAVQERYTGDFLIYWIKNSTQFFKTYTGPLSQPLIEFAVTSYKNSNPEEPVEIAFLPSTVQEMIRGLNYYDPHFGAAFYQGSWNIDFDHAEALQKIECPTLLVHANFEIKDDGILNGAMTQEQADRVVSLVPNCEYRSVNASHVVNLEEPDQFIQIIEAFFLGE